MLEGRIARAAACRRAPQGAKWAGHGGCGAAEETVPRCLGEGASPSADGWFRNHVNVTSSFEATCRRAARSRSHSNGPVVSATSCKCNGR